jgi:hypothetical protein
MAKDKFHDIAKTALENDGWLVTADPYHIKDKNLVTKSLEIDLAAEKLIAAEKGTEKIAVEIKSLIADSTIYEFHSILGQYLNYQVALEVVEPDRTLYIAIPEFGYEKLMKEGLTRLVLARFKIKLIIFDIENQIITKWEM